MLTTFPYLCHGHSYLHILDAFPAPLYHHHPFTRSSTATSCTPPLAPYLSPPASTAIQTNPQDIVALSGAHTLGRAFKNRSGAAPLESTKYTKDGPGTKGGQSWTEEWLKFDNRYFTMLLEAEAGGCDVAHECSHTLRLPGLDTPLDTAQARTTSWT
eukprot:358057-Chlamydomonas_euryale.AAC.2